MSLMRVLPFVASLASVGCGGDGSGGEEPASQASPRTGIFIDSPVSGLSYRSATLSGATDATGHFQYYPGESVTFSIGSVVIGTATGRSTLTPVDFGLSDREQKVINIARFLQSLDRDGNLENGIEISLPIAAEVNGKNIDFSLSSSAFDSDEMKALFLSLNNQGAFTDGNNRSLVGDVAAQYNLRRSLDPTKGPFDGDWWASYEK